MSRNRPRKSYESSDPRDGRIRVPKPPVQRISPQRVRLIQMGAILAAVALTAYDAYVSYQGFQALSLPNQAPLVLALLILVIQLASGSIQQLGMNPFRGVGGSDTMDFLWRWVLASVYLIDVGSNAIAFGIPAHANFAAFRSRPLDALGMSLILLALSALLTFGDEILLRLVDRLVVGSRANHASARKAEIDMKAYRRFLKGYEGRALDNADRAGQNASVDFDWLQEGGQDA